MGMEGGYKPSDEEIKNAEEHMTKSQRYLSQTRENSIKAMAELGVDGFLEAVGFKSVEGLPGEITGVINGHYVRIWEDGFRSGITKGTIDGVELSSEAVNKILDKYKDTVAYHDPSVMTQSEKIAEETLLESIGL